MMRIIFGLVVAIILSGCVAPSAWCWHRPGTNETAMEADLRAAKDVSAADDLATYPNADSTYYQQLVAASRRQDLVAKTMKGKGYVQVPCESATGVASW